jgi:hypothetical protein
MKRNEKRRLELSAVKIKRLTVRELEKEELEKAVGGGHHPPAPTCCCTLVCGG